MPNSVGVPQQQSGIDKVLQAMQMVQAGIGIKTGIDLIKLNSLKKEQIEEEKKTSERLSRSEFTPGEKSNLFEVPRATEGSSRGFVDEELRTAENQLIHDPSTGEVLKQRREFWYIPKENALTQSYLQKNQAAAMQLADAQMERENGILPQNLLKWEIKFKEAPGYQKKWTLDPSTGEKVDIWAAPRTKPTATTNADFPSWVTPSHRGGYQAAKEKGIAEPTVEDVLNYSPENIQKAVYGFKDRIEKSGDMELYSAIKSFDDKVGIDKSVMPDGTIGDKTQEIPGLTASDDATYRIPTSRYFMDKKGLENRDNVQAIINLLIKKRSGTAVSANESERLAAELNTAAGTNNPEAVRNKIAEIRNVLKMGLKNLETGMPQGARDILRKESPMHSESSLFIEKKISNEDAAKQFLNSGG